MFQFGHDRALQVLDGLLGRLGVVVRVHAQVFDLGGVPSEQGTLARVALAVRAEPDLRFQVRAEPVVGRGPVGAGQPGQVFADALRTGLQRRQLLGFGQAARRADQPLEALIQAVGDRGVRHGQPLLFGNRRLIVRDRLVGELVDQADSRLQIFG